MEKLSEKLRRRREERIQAIYGSINRAEWMQAEKEARHLARILTSFKHYTARQARFWCDELRKYRPTAEELETFEAMLQAIRVNIPKEEEDHE